MYSGILARFPLGAALAAVAGLLVTAAGCGRQPPAAPLPPVSSAPAAPPWQLPAPEDPGRPPTDQAAPPSPSDDDNAPVGKSRPPARNPLIRGLGRLADAVPLDEEQTAPLADSLAEADELLTEIKDENQRAIEQLNRQVQLSVERHPNIVLVIANRLGAGELSCAGGELPTPAIDRLAADGVMLTQFYAGDVSPPGALWSLMTGLDTSKATAGFALPSGALLSEMMWQAGYQTAFVGNWTLPSQGRLRGFDDWLGCVDDGDRHFPRQLLSREQRIRIPANADGKQGRFADDLYVEEALSVLRRRDRRRPFLLIVSLTAPGAAAQLGVDDIAAQMVQRLDRDVARIDEQLGALGLRNSTALMVTSSGPPRDGQPPLRGRAGSLYEGGLRVPLVIRWPQRVRRGFQLETPFAMWDLLPTFGALAEAVRQPRGRHGASMHRFLFDPARMRRPPPNYDDRLLYWETRGPQGSAQAVRRGRWKVVRPAGKTGREAVELYDLQTDPEESRDVADQHPQVLESFLIDS